MKTSNKEFYNLKMSQVIIEDDTDCCPWGRNNGLTMVEELNNSTLESMYKVQDAILRLFSNCDIRETQANTINPAQQNVFIPLKTWIINLGGYFAEVSIHQRVLDGCYADFKTL